MNEHALARAYGLRPEQIGARPPRSVSSFHWLADKDRVAHARSTRGDRRFLCGRPVFDERFAWPRASYCAACIRVLGGEVPSTEG